MMKNGRMMVMILVSKDEWYYNGKEWVYKQDVEYWLIRMNHGFIYHDEEWWYNGTIIVSKVQQ